MNYIKPLGVPQVFGLIGHAVFDFCFSSLEFIFNLQKNTVSVLAAYFLYIKDDSQNFLFIILHRVSPFTAWLEKPTSFYHILSQNIFLLIEIKHLVLFCK